MNAVDLSISTGGPIIPVIPEVAIDRRALAGQLAASILASSSPVIVLHGRRAIGKSTLVRHNVMPALLKAGRRVAWGDCAPAPPDQYETADGKRPLAELLGGGYIVVLDGFENLLDLPRDACLKLQDELFGALRAGDPSCRFVFVVDSRHLTAIYALSSYVPDVADGVFEIPPISMVDGLEQLRQHDDGRMVFADELLERLTADAAALADRGWELTADLPAMVFSRLKAATSTSEAAVVDLGIYRRLGGIDGMLRAHLDKGVERVEKDVPGGGEVARAILELVVTSRAQGTRPNFNLLVPRLPVDLAVLGDVRHRLLDNPAMRLLRRSPDRDYELVPAQLGSVIADRIERRRPDVERAQRLVDDGLRSWQRLGVVMPRERFAEVHARRADLAPDADAVRFLLLCALNHASGDLKGADAYWLDRNPVADDARDLLLAALFDVDPAVRRRAAALLAQFHQEEVQERLFLLAVIDPDPDAEVRERVIASLAKITDDGLEHRVREVVANAAHPRRVEAIELLQIFPGPGTVTLLDGLVGDEATGPEARAMAVRVLARIPLKAAVESLARIALYDKDDSDRDEATRALGTLESDELNGMLLEALDVPSTQLRVRLVSGAVGFGMLVAGLAGLAWLVLSVSTGLKSAPALIAIGVGLTLLGGQMLRQVREGRIARFTPGSVTAVVSFLAGLAAIGFVPRGIAHAAIGRWERALAQLGWALLGVALAAVGYWLYEQEARLALVYMAGGALLLMYSYLADVVGALRDTVLLTGTIEAERRRSAVRRNVLSNAVGARLVLHDFQSDDGPRRARARELLRRYGAATHPAELVSVLERDQAATARPVLRALARHREEWTVRALESLWRKGGAALRSAINAVLWARPSERTLEVLDRLAPDMPRVARWRTRMAHWRFRLGVWPREAWATVALLAPVLVLIVYHGWNSLMSPAWSDMQVLRRRGGRLETKLNTVESLARNYPEVAAPFLLGLLADSTYIREDSLQAAIAVGAMQALQKQKGDLRPEDRAVLLGAEPHFEHQLFVGLWWFKPALDALGGMLAFRDPSVQLAARRALVGFVASPRGVRPPKQKEAVIERLAVLLARVALPLLDSLLGLDQEPEAAAALRLEIEHTALHAIEELPQDRVLLAGEALRSAISALSPAARSRKITRGLNALTDAIGEARLDSLRAASVCPASAGRGCADRVAALEAAARQIQAAPGDERGYVTLVAAYDTSYAEAAAALVVYRGRYPHSVWPRKTLSYLYHDQMAARDSAYFRRSYEEALALRTSAEYLTLDAATADRFDADFIEIALSAGQDDDVRTVGAVLTARSDLPLYRLNVALFEYIAAVMRKDGAAADRTLDSLQRVMSGLSDQFYNGWNYDGTSAYIMQSALPLNMKTALRGLCRQGYWFKRAAADSVLASNRAALAALFRPSLRRATQ